MKLTVDSETSRHRVIGYAVVWLAGGLFAAMAVAQFMPAAIANPGAPMTTEVLEAAVRYFPGAAALQARLAARLIDGDAAPDESHDQVAARAYDHAVRAAKAAPANYEYRILLGVAAEQKGDMRSAESALRAAQVLAPANMNVNWLLANFLLRAGKAEDALKHFQVVAAADPGKLPIALNLVWQAMDGNLEALRTVPPETPRGRLALASFLLGQERPVEAAAALDGVDRDGLLTLPESGQVIDRLIGLGQYEPAFGLWRRLAVESGETPAEGVWNGGFELPMRAGLTQFDWMLGQSKYARIQAAPGTGRTGQRALQIAFQGVNTTRFDEEMRQLIRVAPGGRYRLEGFVKANAFAGPEPGPQVTITLPGTKALLAASAPIPVGTYDWIPVTVEFDVPADARALLLSIKQTPALSYADPTTGTLWFDDFVLTGR
ncbi:MAG: tetratricopeptide repeat protein [Blastocatellia bacterium]